MAPPLLRPALPADLPRLIPFVTETMPGGRSREHYARVLTPQWPSSHPNIGFLLEDGAEIVGCFVGLYSTRLVGGRLEHVCNLSAWCVKPAYRKHSLDLVKAILVQPGLSFTSLAATRELQEFWQRMRLKTLDHGMWIVAPLHRPRGLWPTRVVVDPQVLERELDAEERRLLADHAAYGCRGALLQGGDARCLVIAHRRKWRRVGYASILYASDWDFAAARPLALAWAAWRLFRTPLVGLDQRRLPGRPLLAWAVPRDTFFLSPSLSAQDLDSLYSEVVLTYAPVPPL